MQINQAIEPTLKTARITVGVRRTAKGSDAGMTHAERTKRDIAYCCFLPLGMVSLIAAIDSAIPMDSGTAGGMGFLVLIPLTLVALISIPMGIYFSIVLWRDPVLPALSILTILMIAEIVTEAGSVTFYNATAWVYAILVLVLEANWFLLRRRRTFPS